MSRRLERIQVRNFRSLANVPVDTRSVNVLFGPNGAGKSTFLDTVWFLRDCAIRGVDVASSDRSHGIGALWDGADAGANISIELETAKATYRVLFGYSSGRIEPYVGESLHSKITDAVLIERNIGSDHASFYHAGLGHAVSTPLREPEKLALTRYIDFQNDCTEALDVDKLLRFIHLYHSRSADLYSLKRKGSESSYQTWVWERGQNLWSVLRNLHDRKGIDDRYNTILSFMQMALPGFKDLLIEQTGPETVYGHFIEMARKLPIRASGVSDGHLQLLLHLTCLFSEGPDRESVIIFDEPEISLHPYALSVLGKAVRLAAEEWSKQVFIATHSPVLISQFEPEDILATELGTRGETIITRASELESIADLLQEYALGSLYMAGLLAPQSLAAGESAPLHENWLQMFRWPMRTSLTLEDGSKITVEPHTYLKSREAADSSERQKKFLRLYRVTKEGGVSIPDVPEIEIERLIGQ